MSEHRVLSGIQPSGDIHIGNYFGAIASHIALQKQYPGECLFFIADYHALTSVHNAAALRASVREVAATYVALGLDPERACLFRQSDVPEVTELTWMLSCVTGMGLLERAHSYKDKIAKGLKPSMGLFTYPILMAADILAYGSTLVPVGKDQVQHVEMAQDMATYFNEAFNPGVPILRRPEWKLSTSPYVPGLDGAKMSKSYNNTIPLFASGKPLRKLVGKIVTDSTPLGQPLNADTCNAFALLVLFCDEAEQASIRAWYREGAREGEPFGYGHAKMLLAEKMETRFTAARRRYEHLLAEPAELEAALTAGAQRARKLAIATLERCRHACGLRG